MAYGLSNGHVTDDVTWPPKVLWGSTVGYPSDSLASCYTSVIRLLFSWVQRILSHRYFVFICYSLVLERLCKANERAASLALCGAVLCSAVYRCIDCCSVGSGRCLSGSCQ